MLDLVDVGDRSLAAYRGTAPDALLDDLIAAAAPLKGARVLHVNATPYGGGVSELLRSEIPLLNDLGLVADWRIISGDDAFFQVTKTIHNGLQGGARELTDAERGAYLANAHRNAAALTEEYDFVFVHDPQPAALLPLHGKGRARWVWRCHIDTAAPNPQVWGFLRTFLHDYDASIFTMAEFVPPDIPVRRVEIYPPAIDPLSPKNLPLPRRLAEDVLEWIGVHPHQPLVTQVSRFDAWKDPLGVVAAWQQARKAVPGLQLALVGSLALDDPEGRDVYRAIEAVAKDDPLVHVFTNLVGVGNIEVNAFQALSDVVVQKSLREGFGLVVSEAMWKGTPVVAGRAGGIPLQMADGAGGVLVDSVDECAAAMVRLLTDRGEAKRLGEAGRERVREHFLTPRLLLNHVRLMAQLAAERPIVADATERDPVCGMALARPPTATETVGGKTYGFCSERCRSVFAASAARYVRARPCP